VAAVDCELVVSVAVVTEAEVGDEVVADSCEPLPAVTPVEEVVVVVMTTIGTVVCVCRLQVCKEHFELVVWVHF